MPSTIERAAPVRILLAGAIDYAGLFPPAELDLTRALSEYLAIREGDERWALGRFVVPAARLPELVSALATAPTKAGFEPVAAAAVIGTALADDIVEIERTDRDARGVVRVETVEVKAGSAGASRAVLAAIPASAMRYLEVAPGPGLEPVLDVVAAAGARAKLRTGGVTPEAFPDPAAVLDFLEACARRRLRFKATAGLHHPVRGEYRLTYAPDALRGRMYGYLNLICAAALVWGGARRDEAEAVLLESASVRIGEEGVRLGSRLVTADELARARAEFLDGFGSCSFREPIDELAPLVHG